jgi:hypothetical protein
MLPHTLSGTRRRCSRWWEEMQCDRRPSDPTKAPTMAQQAIAASGSPLPLARQSTAARGNRLPLGSLKALL